MSFLRYSLISQDKGEENVSSSTPNQLVFYYPCTSPFFCTDYELFIYPGVYKIEVYGASGGYKGDFISAYKTSGKCPFVDTLPIKTNVKCNLKVNTAGSGGYASGIITLRSLTKAFLSIGGKGQYTHKIEEKNNDKCYLRENMIEGGYNGGGWASNFYNPDECASAGGATDLRFEENDVFHRVIVAGGGGGTDDQTRDDGQGGAGGGETAQSFFKNGVENKTLIANQTYGFAFGSGESVQKERSKHKDGATGSGASDRGGGGGGWFGGFSAQSNNGGGGGGSSFILTSNYDFTTSEFEHCDTFRENCETKQYAFAHTNKYSFAFPQHYPGVWAGNGMAIITQISSLLCTRSHDKHKSLSIFVYLMILMK